MSFGSNPFQHTAARRRLMMMFFPATAERVSTHSRPKAAVIVFIDFRQREQSFNTQPPEGGCYVIPPIALGALVSTHSRPKAAGY